MAGKNSVTLETLLLLKGKVDNTFSLIGDSLESVGTKVNALSQKIINFGKENLSLFSDYDDLMREVKALGGYTDKSIDELDNYNKTIAQTSRYTMEQAANSEKLMAQLGLNMDQIRTLMPSVMSLATAANIDLKSSLDYLYYSLNAIGMPMEDASLLADQMAKAASISAADINTLGLSLQRLGSGSQFFAGGSGEVLAILSGIAQFGHDMQGTTAGTQLRNFILTLLAPTKGKAQLLEELELTNEEWDEFENDLDDAGITINNTAETMKKLGFSVYDSTGKLKNGIQIIKDLDAALSGMSESEKNSTLGQLFGKRTTITAANLMAALGDIIAYQERIEKESQGFTQSMVNTMEGGIGGAMRRLSAAWEGLQVTLGEKIAPLIETLSGFLTNITNALANMDDNAMNTLVGAATGLATAGPMILLAASAFKTIGLLMTPGGQFIAGILIVAAGIGALAAAIDNADRAARESFIASLGDMELDSAALLAHVNTIGDAFSGAYDEVNQYNNAIDAAIKDYETASTKLSGKLTTAMITGATLSETDIAEIKALGSNMGAAFNDGINASFDKSASYLSLLFGGDAANDPEYQGTILMMNSIKDQMMARAKELGKAFGDELGKAMDDSIITGEEYSAIIEKMQAYNDAMALAAKADIAAEMAVRLDKAQGVSLESAEKFLKEQAAILTQNTEEARLTHLSEKAKESVYYDEAIEKGFINPLTGIPYTTQDKEAALADMDSGYEAMIAEYERQNAEIIKAVFDSLFAQGEMSNAWQMIRTLYGENGPPTDAKGNLQYGAIDYSKYFVNGRLPDGISNELDALYRKAADFDRLLNPIMGAGAAQKASALLNSVPFFYHDINETEYLNELKAMFKDGASIDVDGDTTKLEDAIDAQDGRTISVEVWYTEKGIPHGNGGGGTFAHGGRADTASIFGEAGPEWAIPEQHTERTAHLLDMARRASGFTWPELISRNGGLNSGNGRPTQLVYSPTIIANDASSVESRLREDKDRLDRWWREKQLHDAVEVYA